MVTVKVFVLAEKIQRCHTKRRRQTPRTRACSRLLRTASDDFAKRTALHASSSFILKALPTCRVPLAAPSFLLVVIAIGSNQSGVKVMGKTMEPPLVRPFEGIFSVPPG